MKTRLNRKGYTGQHSMSAKMHASLVKLSQFGRQRIISIHTLTFDALRTRGFATYCADDVQSAEITDAGRAFLEGESSQNSLLETK